jgi:hypothetical protein
MHTLGAAGAMSSAAVGHGNSPKWMSPYTASYRLMIELRAFGQTAYVADCGCQFVVETGDLPNGNGNQEGEAPLLLLQALGQSPTAKKPGYTPNHRITDSETRHKCAMSWREFIAMRSKWCAAVMADNHQRRLSLAKAFYAPTEPGILGSMRTPRLHYVP